MVEKFAGLQQNKQVRLLSGLELDRKRGLDRYRPAVHCVRLELPLPNTVDGRASESQRTLHKFRVLY